MVRDLGNIRAVALYLSKTELKFDLVSAVDELSKQVWNVKGSEKGKRMK